MFSRVSITNWPLVALLILNPAVFVRCWEKTSAEVDLSKSAKNYTVEATELLTFCVFIEDDSWYTTWNRLAATVDLAIAHVNAYMLQTTKYRVQARYQSTGPSCSSTQYSATAMAFLLIHESNVKCDVFFGAST